MAKKRHIASKLIMDRENLRVLDIGSGWGGMALHLARQFYAKVTGVTLPDEQHAVSNQRAREDKFAGQVEFRLQDYRHIDSKFDRIVSVGMCEHVGRKHYRSYFDKCAALLEGDGVMSLHTIGQSSPLTPTNPFIEKYIFPGGYIPSLSDIIAPIEQKRPARERSESARHRPNSGRESAARFLLLSQIESATIFFSTQGLWRLSMAHVIAPSGGLNDTSTVFLALYLPLLMRTKTHMELR